MSIGVVLIIGAFSIIGALVPVFRVILLAAVIAAGIYFWGKIFLANVVLVVEDAAVFASMETSSALIKNHWWRSATVYTVALIIALVFYFVVVFVSTFVAEITASPRPC